MLKGEVLTIENRKGLEIIGGNLKKIACDSKMQGFLRDMLKAKPEKLGNKLAESNNIREGTGAMLIQLQC
jgi:hypothetical protein